MYSHSFPPPPTSIKPRRVTAHPVDPVAVVLGNASLLGVGYLFMRRPRLAAAALAGTVFLGIALAVDPDAVFWRILLAVWWSATIIHTWWLMRHPAPERPLIDIDDPQPTWRTRVFAVGVAGMVLATFMGLRLDALLIVQSAAQVHEDGDCERAIVSLEQLDATHRIAYGSMTATGEADLAACRLLVAALDQRPGEGAATLESYLEHLGARWDGAGPKRAEFLLRTARSADVDVETVLKTAFSQLSVTLEKSPGQSGRVKEVVEGFVSDLGEETSPCRAKRVNDWVYARDWDAPEIAEPVADGAGNVPERMLDCARARFDADDFDEARGVYEQFLDEFPDHRQADRAADELYEVESAIERLNVERLLEDEQYCGESDPYRGAEPYKGKGPHEMWMFGLDPDDHGFPKSWTTQDVDDTVLAVCVDGPTRGSFQQSCYYESKMSPFGATKVKFYASKFKIKAYEIKTGKRVASYTKEIGDPCPAVLTYETFGVDMGPPSEVESKYTDGTVRSMFDRLMD